jgi:hypothetical protein
MKAIKTSERDRPAGLKEKNKTNLSANQPINTERNQNAAKPYRERFQEVGLAKLSAATRYNRTDSTTERQFNSGRWGIRINE